LKNEISAKMMMAMDVPIRRDDRFFSLIITTLMSCGCKRLLFCFNLPIPMIPTDVIPIIPNEKVIYRIFGLLAIMYRARADCVLNSSFVLSTSLSSSWNDIEYLQRKETLEERKMFLNDRGT